MNNHAILSCRSSYIPVVASILILLGVLVGRAMATVAVYTEDPWEQMDIYPREVISVVGSQIVIDGDINDWNPAAFYLMYNIEATKDQYALRVAFSYDADGIAFAVRFNDHNPMLNHCDPMVNPKAGWDGDSFQLRLTEKPTPKFRDTGDNIALVTLWYQTEKRSPALHIMYGCDAHEQLVLTGSESQLFFRPSKGGYVIEGFLPYEILRQKQPTPGSTWRFQVQGNFSDAGGKSVHVVYDCFVKQVSFFKDPRGWGRGLFVSADDVTAQLKAKKVVESQKRGGAGDQGIVLPFTYDNPAEGFVSLAVRNESQQIVRTLRMKARQAAGQISDKWDGLDDNGKPIAPGRYTIHGITHPGINSKFIASVHNSGNPPWQGVDSSSQWGGDHGPAVDVVADDQGNCYLIWENDEKGTALIKVDSSGQKLWGGNSSWGEISRDGVCAVAYHDGQVYMAKSSGKAGLLAYNAQTGDRELFPNGKGVFIISENFGDKLGTKLPADCSNSPRINLTDLTVAKGYLFSALHKENEIRVYRLDTFEHVTTIAIEHPLSLAWNEKTNSLHCISLNNLVAVEDPLGKQPKIRSIVSRLDQPHGLVVDRDGVNWVGLRGKTQQVIGLDANGRKAGEVGKPGGRPWIGKFDPQGMLQPAGIAIDKLGRLWVMEEDNLPRRQSVWDMESGKLIRDFFGPSAYSPMMAPDLDDPENVFIHNTRFVVNYETGDVTPAATVYRRGHIPNTPHGAQHRYHFMGQTFGVTSYQGKKYAYDGHGGVYAYTDADFKPLLHIGGAFKGLSGIKDEWTNRRGMATGYGAVWRDQNGDHQFSRDEVRLIKGMNLRPNILRFGGTFFPGARFIAGRRVFAPQGVDQYGAPIYPEPEDATPIFTGDGPMTKISRWQDVWPSLKDDWNSFYAIASRGGNTYAGDNVTDGIYKFRPDGQILWRYAPVGVGFGLKKNIAKPGQLFGALRVVGLIDTPDEQGGEIIGIGCYRGYVGFLTEDGLYVDQFGTDVGYGPKADYNTMFIENFSGYLFKHHRTGKVYLFAGATDGRIIELSGWDKIRRIEPVTVTVTEQQHQAAVRSIALKSNHQQIATKLRVTARAEGRKDWTEPVLIAIDDQRSAQVSLMYDAEHLHARFVVNAPVSWRNASKDWHYDFKGGDAVDIHLGDMRAAADRKKKSVFLPGDVRVLITPDDGSEGFNAVAFWKRVPAELAKEPFTFISPVASESFERVERLKGVQVKLTKKTKGYVAVVSVPWRVLHRPPPKAGQVLLGDVGVLLSGESGSRTILRRYFFNKDTNIVDDVPSESRLAPAYWGSLEFD